jgi:type IV pilus assembly protein PilM
MPAIQPGVWGIDLGQCALKALRVEYADGQVTATAFDYVEHPKILSQPDADPDQLIREALEKFLSRNEIRGDTVAISVPGQSGLARFVKLPPVEEKKIVDIVRFEAKQQIPFNLDEVVWDYQKIGAGVVSDGFAMETEIGLFAMKRDMVNRYLQHFKDVGVEVHVVQMAPLALCNYVSYDVIEGGGEGGGDEEAANKKRCVVSLDIGADSSNLVITDGNRIIWQRPIPLGGNHFTRALTKDMKLTFAKAEHLKRNATKSPDLKKILSSLKPVLNDFVSEVQRSLGYFTNTHRDAHVSRLVGLGNAFRLPGMQRFLEEKLQLPVVKLTRMNRLEGDAVVTAPAFTENIPSFAVAYGLALQGALAAQAPADRTRIQTNLLPGEIQVERMIRAKKPWAVTAAAALLLGGAALTLSYALENRVVGAPQVEKAVETVNAAKGQISGEETRFNGRLEEVKAKEKKFRMINAGLEERLNWLHLTKFISDCLPRPDGSNLYSEVARANYLDKGKKAYEKLVLHNTGKETLAGTDFDNVRRDLIRFNIDEFDSLYCEDLGPLPAKVNALGVVKNHIQPPVKDDFKLEGKGWIIEVRGSTEHALGDRFVLEALVENIARTPILGQAAPKPAAGGDAAPPAGSTGSTAEKAAPPTAEKPAEAQAAARAPSQVPLVFLYRAEANTALPSVLPQLAEGAAVTPGVPAGTGALAEGGTREGVALGGVTASGWVRPPSSGRARGDVPAAAGFGFGTQGTQEGVSPDGVTPAVKKPSGVTRTDFVVYFVWKEAIDESVLPEKKKAPAVSAPAGEAGSGFTPAPTSPAPGSGGSEGMESLRGVR